MWNGPVIVLGCLCFFVTEKGSRYKGGLEKFFNFSTTLNASACFVVLYFVFYTMIFFCLK